MPEKPPSSRERPRIVPMPRRNGATRQSRPGEPAYAELLAASNFSFLRGASHPEEIAATASVLGLAGFSITDRNTLAGIVRGHLAAKETDGRYVVGCRLSFCDGTPDIAVWPRDRAAYGRLCRLLTTGNLRTKKGECHLDLSDLIEWGAGMEIAVLAAAHPLPRRERVVGGADQERGSPAIGSQHKIVEFPLSPPLRQIEGAPSPSRGEGQPLAERRRNPRHPRRGLPQPR